MFKRYFTHCRIKRQLKLALRCMNILTVDIFACFLEPAYPTNLYAFERGLHKRKNNCLRMIKKLDELAQLTSDKKLLVDKLAHIFEVIMDVAELRQRVSDHTIFSVIDRELSDILLALNADFLSLLQYLAKKEVMAYDHLLPEKISALESSYFSVVNVAAKEPLVFLLFIDSLKSLNELLQDFSGLLEGKAA